MNKVILKGRLVRDPEFLTNKNGNNIAKFSIAIDRDFKNKDGETETDFINCVAFKKTAEFISMYFKKGQEALILGSIRINNFQDKEGNNRYSTDIVVDKIEFCGKREEKKEEISNDPYAEYGESVTIDDNFLD